MTLKDLLNISLETKKRLLGLIAILAFALMLSGSIGVAFAVAGVTLDLAISAILTGIVLATFSIFSLYKAYYPDQITTTVSDEEAEAIWRRIESLMQLCGMTKLEQLPLELSEQLGRLNDHQRAKITPSMALAERSGGTTGVSNLFIKPPPASAAPPHGSGGSELFHQRRLSTGSRDSEEGNTANRAPWVT